MTSIASSLAPQGPSAAVFENFPEAPPKPDSNSIQGSSAKVKQGATVASDGDVEMGAAVEKLQGEKGNVEAEDRQTIEEVIELPGYGNNDQDDDAGSLQDAEGEDDDTIMNEVAAVGGQGSSASPETRRGPARSGRPPPEATVEVSDGLGVEKIEKPKRRRSSSVKKQGEEEDEEFDPSGDIVKEGEISSQEEPSDYDEAESGRPKKKPKAPKPAGRPPAPTAVPLIKAENPRDPAKVWECIIGDCKKAFVRKNDLQRHIKSHNDTREFQCSFENCNKAFLQRSALHVHERVHTGEQPYACEVCERKFADTSSLARHRRIHTGVRPYKCEAPGCGRDFCRKITLQNHTASQHPPDGIPPARKKRAKKGDGVDGTEEGSEAPVKVKKPRKKKDENPNPGDPSGEQANPSATPQPKRVRKPKAPKVDDSPPPPTSIPPLPTRTVPKRARVVPPRYADSPPPSSHASSFAQPSSAPPSEPQQAPIAWSLPPPRSFKLPQPAAQSSPSSPHLLSTPVAENRQSLYHLPETIQPVDAGLNQRVEEELEQLYQFACADESEEETPFVRCSSVPPPSIPFQSISVRSTLSEPPLSPRPFFASFDKPSQTLNLFFSTGPISHSVADQALEEEEEDLYA